MLLICVILIYCIFLWKYSSIPHRVIAAMITYQLIDWRVIMRLILPPKTKKRGTINA